MQAWYLYIIENKHRQLYTGVTTDIPRRFSEHQSSTQRCAKALKGKGPLQMRFCCELADKSRALKMELWVKKLSRERKLQLIENTLEHDFDTQVLNFKQIQAVELSTAYIQL